jgi:hypothetical protein
MSYSRWGNSVFYTYWAISDSNERDGQIFDICGVKSYTYREIKEFGLDGIIENLKEFICECNKPENKDKGENIFVPGEYTDEEYEELKGYIREFMKDVEDEYNTPSQLYKDGKITLQDAFLGEL